MKKLRGLAEEAAKDLKNLQTDGLGKGLREFADYLNHMVTQGAMKFDSQTWRQVAERCDENLANDVELYRWICGVAGEASLLMVPGQQQISKAKLAKNIISLCAAIEQTKPRQRRASRPKK